MRQSEGCSEVYSKSRSIAFAGLSVAISLICLILFRGVLSIIQAIIIPVVIVLLGFKQPLTYLTATALSLLVLTLIIFPVQVVFVLTYILLAVFLQIVDHYSKHQPILRWSFRLLYFFFVGLMLYLGIIITDLVLGTQLNAMMNQLSQGNNMIYFMIILLEALIVSIIHIVSLSIIRRRVNKIHNIEQ